jgi:hypothetical protein
MIWNIWDVLRGVELGIYLHDPLLAGHLVEILIVEDTHDPTTVGPRHPKSFKSATIIHENENAPAELMQPP